MTLAFDFARSGDKEALSKELDTHPEELERVNEETNLTCLGAAVSHGHLPTVEMLIEKGADKNVKGEDGWSLLHMAAYQNHAEIAKFLVEKGHVAVSVQDIQGRNPSNAMSLQVYNHC